MVRFRGSTYRGVAPIAALAFLLMLPPPPAAAIGTAQDGCFACENCFAELSCLGCGVLTLNAISGCCGLGGGTAYCMAEWGGFAVVCDGGATACDCNMIGGGCAPMIMEGG